MADIFRLRVFINITGIDSEDVVYKLAGGRWIQPITLPITSENVVDIIRSLCDTLQDVVASAEGRRKVEREFMGEESRYGDG